MLKSKNHIKQLNYRFSLRPRGSTDLRQWIYLASFCKYLKSQSPFLRDGHTTSIMQNEIQPTSPSCTFHTWREIGVSRLLSPLHLTICQVTYLKSSSRSHTYKFLSLTLKGAHPTLATPKGTVNFAVKP